MPSFIFILAIVSAGALLLNGCSSPDRPRAFATSGELTELNLLTTPVGLDLDGKPGIDGFSLKVYPGIAESPKAVPIRSGTLEILMFDGTLFGRADLPAPLKIWTFNREQLRNYEFSSGIGAGYELALSWGENVPTHSMISVGARYTSPTGRIVTSSLTSVTVLNKQAR